MNKEDLPMVRQRSYCSEIRAHPTITDLVNTTPVFRIAEELLGCGNVLPVESGQIALRFPHKSGTELPLLRGHIDGLGSGINGHAIGTYRRHFTLIAFILLSDLSESFRGNFTVWPKSHRLYECYFKQNGHEVLSDGLPELELPEPVQVNGNPGDLVLAHHLLLHTGAPNMSPHIRYAVIFRLKHRECDAFGYGAYTDIWREWPALREAVKIDN